MSAEENKALQRRIVDEFVNHGDKAAAIELVAEDHVTFGAGTEPIRGKQPFIDQVISMRGAFPDLEYRIEDQVAEGDTVACFIVFRGVHEGVFFRDPTHWQASGGALCDV